MSISESWAALEADLIGGEPDYTTDPEPIDAGDLDRANRQLARLAKVRRRARSNREVAEAQVRQVMAWAEAERVKTDQAEAWISASLAGWHAAVLANDPARKTINLPAGGSAARKTQAVWEVDDETFLPWAAANAPEVVRQRPAPAPEVDRAELKRRFVIRDEKDRIVEVGVTPDGERPPGLTVTPGTVEYRFTIDEGDRR